MIRHCRKECTARIYLVNIGPSNEHYKVMLPGIEQAILTYNHVIAKTAAAEGASRLDVFALVSREGLEKAQPDGAHLSVHGHQCLFAELVRRLVEEGLMPPFGSAATMATRLS